MTGISVDLKGLVPRVVHFTGSSVGRSVLASLANEENASKTYCLF